MGNRPSKILLLDMDSEVTRSLCRRLLKMDVHVVSVGKSETKLGDLKSFSNFTFYRLDLSAKDIVRSYIYGIDTIIFFDHSNQILEKIEHLFLSIMHMKSSMPRIFFISSCHVFKWEPNRFWLEEDILDPDSDLGELISGAESMVKNYASKISIPVCILRIPRFVDRQYVDSSFLQFIKILKSNEQIDFDISLNLAIQFINLDGLIHNLSQLFHMRWDGIEIFHIESYQQNFIPLFDSLKIILGSKSSLLKDNKLTSFIKECLTVSPLVRKRIDEFQKVHSVNFLRQPVLNCKKSERILNVERFELKQLLRHISIK